MAQLEWFLSRQRDEQRNKREIRGGGVVSEWEKNDCMPKPIDCVAFVQIDSSVLYALALICGELRVIDFIREIEPHMAYLGNRHTFANASIRSSVNFSVKCDFQIFASIHCIASWWRTNPIDVIILLHFYWITLTSSSCVTVAWLTNARIQDRKAFPFFSIFRIRLAVRIRAGIPKSELRNTHNVKNEWMNFNFGVMTSRKKNC